MKLATNEEDSIAELKIPADTLLTAFISQLEAKGLEPRDAEISATHFVEAELRGWGGVSRFLAFWEGWMPTERSAMSVEQTSPTTTRIVGTGKPGYTVARETTSIAIDEAKNLGLAFAVGSGHRTSGVLGLYVEHAARKGVLAIALSSSNRLLVAPFGSRDRMLSTNPIAIGIPTADDDPIVWDAATARIRAGALSGDSELPPGSAIDIDGSPTTDPAAARQGAILPWGGHKGSGLSLAIQLMGLLTLEARPGNDENWESVFMIWCVDADARGVYPDYRERVSAFADLVRQSTPLDPNDPVRLPSDRAMASRLQRISEGIPIPSHLWKTISEI